MTIEKMQTTPRFSRAMGVAMAVIGASLIAASLV
jgi:hypothetical protein